MSFRAWCCCQQVDADRRAEALLIVLQRQRIRKEHDAEIARLWAAIEHTV